MTIKECLLSTFRYNALNFLGRASRKEFIIATGLYAALKIGLQTILTHNNVENSDKVMLLFDIVVLLPFFSLAFRRVHDFGRSAWFFICLGILAPILCCFLASFAILSYYGTNSFLAVTIVNNIIVFLPYSYFMCKKSDAGNNKYGPAPKSW